MMPGRAGTVATNGTILTQTGTRPPFQEAMECSHCQGTINQGKSIEHAFNKEMYSFCSDACKLAMIAKQQPVEEEVPGEEDDDVKGVGLVYKLTKPAGGWHTMKFKQLQEALRERNINGGSRRGIKKADLIYLLESGNVAQ